MNGVDNLIPQSQRTKEEQREIARMGGIASGEARRKKKTIAQALRKVLDEQIAADGTTRLDGIARNALKALYNEPTIKGLKILAEILGELDVNLNLGESSEMGIRIVDTRKKMETKNE